MNNNLLLEVKILLNNQLYEDKIIPYLVFENMQNKLVERMKRYEYI